MMIWLLLYAAASFAQDPSVDEFCFTQSVLMKQVLLKSRFILVPSDKTQEDGDCFSVRAAPHRRELIQNYIKNIDPSVIIRFSSTELKREHCHLKVEKIKQGSKTVSEVGLAPSPRAGVNEAYSEANETSTIQTWKEFSFQVNQDSIQGQCNAINSNRYEITLTVKKDPIPPTPPLPTGTVVVVPPVDIYEKQETFKLQTIIQLSRGERIEIRRIVKDLRSSKNDASILSGAEKKNERGEDTEKIYLSLE